MICRKSPRIFDFRLRLERNGNFSQEKEQAGDPGILSEFCGFLSGSSISPLLGVFFTCKVWKNCEKIAGFKMILKGSFSWVFVPLTFGCWEVERNKCKFVQAAQLECYGQVWHS